MGRPFSFNSSHKRLLARNFRQLRRSSSSMIQYRFITAKQRGKWYGTLVEAQRFASRIGAGFLDAAGTFVAYRGTVLEMRSVP